MRTKFTPETYSDWRIYVQRESTVSVVEVDVLHAHAAARHVELRVARAAVGGILLETRSAGRRRRRLAAGEQEGEDGGQKKEEVFHAGK